MPPVRDVIGVLPFLGALEESENDRMPRVEDDSPKMPRVPDDRAERRPGAGAFWLFPILPF
jgi:hypothetical protein